MADDPKPEVLKGHCPNCGPSRFADVVGNMKNAMTMMKSGSGSTQLTRSLGVEGAAPPTS